MCKKLTEEEKIAKKERKEALKKEGKGFFGEFRKFISRGNVVDLAVGVIIGGAFTAIVTALSDKILKPLINGAIYGIAKLCGASSTDPLSAMYTILVPVYKVNEKGEQVLDLASSTYIDWGAFISAIINFLLVALILFLIVRALNRLNQLAVDSGKRVKEQLATDELKREEK